MAQQHSPAPGHPAADRISPDRRDALRVELGAARRDAGLSVVFGGEVRENGLRLTEFLGTRTNGLRNLDVRPGAGLGGRVVAQRRPAGVADYGSARNITHDYDAPVLAEGISGVIAVPVLVGGECRAVLYGAARQRMPLGDRARDALMAAGARLARQLVTRDDIDDKLALVESAASAPPAAPPDHGEGADLEEVRAVYSELRSIAGTTPDPTLRERIHAAAQRLTTVGERRPAQRPTVRLSAREVDVLAQVALGCTNIEVSNRLYITPETVKSYLASAMRKLDANTRYEAVVRARSAWLLP